jgi:hypothetical protein
MLLQEDSNESDGTADGMQLQNRTDYAQIGTPAAAEVLDNEEGERRVCKDLQSTVSPAHSPVIGSHLR